MVTKVPTDVAATAGVPVLQLAWQSMVSLTAQLMVSSMSQMSVWPEEAVEIAEYCVQVAVELWRILPITHWDEAEAVTVIWNPTL
jgi:hypothetical protein